MSVVVEKNAKKILACRSPGGEEGLVQAKAFLQQAAAADEHRGQAKERQEALEEMACDVWTEEEADGEDYRARRKAGQGDRRLRRGRADRQPRVDVGELEVSGPFDFDVGDRLLTQTDRRNCARRKSAGRREHPEARPEKIHEKRVMHFMGFEDGEGEEARMMKNPRVQTERGGSATRKRTFAQTRMLQVDHRLRCGKGIAKEATSRGRIELFSGPFHGQAG